MNELYVLDAWAILAFLQKEEPAGSRVRQLFLAAQEQKVTLYSSIINIGEVYYSIGKSKGQHVADETLDEIRSLRLLIHPVIENTVMTAARFKISYPISYADAFAAATVVELDGILVTGTLELLQLEGKFRVEKLTRSKR